MTVMHTIINVWGCAEIFPCIFLQEVTQPEASTRTWLLVPCQELSRPCKIFLLNVYHKKCIKFCLFWESCIQFINSLQTAIRNRKNSEINEDMTDHRSCEHKLSSTKWKKKTLWQGRKLSFQFTCPFGQVQCVFYLSGPQNYLSQKVGNSNSGFKNSFFISTCPSLQTWRQLFEWAWTPSPHPIYIGLLLSANSGNFRQVEQCILFVSVSL